MLEMKWTKVINNRPLDAELDTFGLANSYVSRMTTGCRLFGSQP